jgi:hypothetical protein
MANLIVKDSSGADVQIYKTGVGSVGDPFKDLQIGIETETAPGSDTASSGLNGRLQRVAQRLTSILTAIVLPTALSNNNMRVSLQETALPTTIRHGRTTVTTVGTRVALGSSAALLTGVTIKALNTNTGNIFVGGSTVSSSNGALLRAGESLFLEIDNVATVNIDCSVNGEGVTYLGS